MNLPLDVEAIVDVALAEDIGLGDVTTQSVVGADQRGRARIEPREPAVVCGLDVLERVYARVDAGLAVRRRRADGDAIAPGDRVVEMEGSLRSILTGERVALNFLQRLSGVATLTRRYVEAIPSGCKTVIVDTRKTTPGMRALERHAVRCGGGRNHRPRLDGGVLIKDNHIDSCGSVALAVQRARDRLGPALRLEVEVRTLEELEEALSAGAEVVMLDNMDLDGVREAMARVRGRALVEVSGRVSVEAVGDLARLGVDFISVGALTHSARAVDYSLSIDPC